MNVYLSCDRENAFFISSAIDARDKINSGWGNTNAVRLIYPPRKIGLSGPRNIQTNVLLITTADLVILDMTPKLLKVQGQRQRVPKHNEGVLIEYGISLGMKKMMGKGIYYRPSYRVFCSQAFPRQRLPPIASAEDVEDYDPRARSRAKLVEKIESEMRHKATEILARGYPRIVEPSETFSQEL